MNTCKNFQIHKNCRNFPKNICMHFYVWILLVIMRLPFYNEQNVQKSVQILLAEWAYALSSAKRLRLVAKLRQVVLFTGHGLHVQCKCMRETRNVLWMVMNEVELAGNKIALCMGWRFLHILITHLFSSAK